MSPEAGETRVTSMPPWMRAWAPPQNSAGLAGQKSFDKYGTWAVFLSRLVPVARSLISLPASVTRMSLLPFMLLTFAGSFIWSLGLAYAGYQLGENWESIRDIMRPVEIPILIAVLLLVAYYVYRHVRQLRAHLKDSSGTETERHVP